METLMHGFATEVRDSDIPIDCIAIVLAELPGGKPNKDILMLMLGFVPQPNLQLLDFLKFKIQKSKFKS